MNKSNLINIILVVIIILLSIVIHILYKKDPIQTDFGIMKALSTVDSLQKENDSLKVERTILIHEADKLKHSIDSLNLIRPQTIKRINNEISRLHNSDTPAKLLIGDSILRSRKKNRSPR